MIEERKTEIIDQPIELCEEASSYQTQRDQLFETLKKVLLDESSLVEKFYHYCDQYIEYHYDVQGLGENEAEDALRKVKILENKLIQKAQESLDFEIVDQELLAKLYQLKFICADDQFRFSVIFEASVRSFDLEVV